MIDYRYHALEAFIAGVCMCLVSRLTHILAKPGSLRHESYMAMYSYVFTACVMPLFIFMNLRFEEEELQRYHKLDDIPLSVKVGGFALLFFLMFLKNFHMERGIMKRFIEDYDPEVHE